MMTTALRLVCDYGFEVAGLRLIRWRAMVGNWASRRVAAKVGFHADQKLLEVSTAVNVIEQRVRQAVPSARVIYLEPDVYVDPNLSAPPTDTIVIKGLE